ncbi:protein ALP1-like [Sitophilus oryzae]|uniref:Protein ALP1-like n=1 Tax=Sitophilus oryzae TaxID=7048 RepID=A0A6J2YAN1_SITOR|nr:protein ALP1-like [Sitophilus oryzae]
MNCFGEKDALLAAAACVIIFEESERKSRKRRFWVRHSLQARSIYSGTHLLEDLKKDDCAPLNWGLEYKGSFKNFCRMSSSDFEHLINLIGPKIQKSDTRFRDAVPVVERLAITLRFLATGDSYQSLMYLFKVSKQLISLIVPEVCDALIECLQENVKLPTTAEEWQGIATDFYRQWNFPNCLGSMDGKHVMLQAPFGSGTEYFNYKGFFSIVLFGVVDANYCFIFVNAGCQGRISDGGVFANTTLKSLIAKNDLNLPEASPLPGRSNPVPYAFIGDDAFTLQPHLLKPYAGLHDRGSGERIFNYRISRARRIVENAFGIISSVFRVLRKPMLIEPNKATKVVLACVHLHNFLKRSSTSKNIYTPPGTFDTEDFESGTMISGQWRVDQTNMTSLFPLRKVPRKASASAYEIRDEFRDFFLTSQGKVAWQDKY